MKEEDKLLLNLARLYMSDEKEMVKTAKYINLLSIKGLSELKRLHTVIPNSLVAHEQFLKDLISATAVYLAETKNWYNNDKLEEL